jgi:hypothetical protein
MRLHYQNRHLKTIKGSLLRDDIQLGDQVRYFGADLCGEKAVVAYLQQRKSSLALHLEDVED